MSSTAVWRGAGTVPVMISFLRGEAIAPDTVLVGGVGYHVTTPAGLPVGEEVEVWVHTAVRENDISLYGFSTVAERSLFLALTKVAGVGPAAATKVLSLGVAVVAAALRDGDPKPLTRAAGVGPKAAQSIVAGVKLSQALLDQLGTAPAEPDPFAGVHDALAGLGFADAAARAAVAQIVSDEPGTPAPVVLRKAIALLGSKAA